MRDVGARTGAGGERRRPCRVAAAAEGSRGASTRRVGLPVARALRGIETFNDARGRRRGRGGSETALIDEGEAGGRAGGGFQHAGGHQRGVQQRVADDVGVVAGCGVGAGEGGEILARHRKGIGVGVVEHDVAVGHGGQDGAAVGRGSEYAGRVHGVGIDAEGGQFDARRAAKSMRSILPGPPAATLRTSASMVLPLSAMERG